MDSFPEPIVYKSGDDVLRVWPCVHCGSCLDEGGAANVLARWRETVQLSVCCVCNEEIVQHSFDLTHETDGPRPEWKVSPTDPAVPVAILVHDPRARSMASALHKQCARAALPFLPSNFWESTDGGACRLLSLLKPFGERGQR